MFLICCFLSGFQNSWLNIPFIVWRTPVVILSYLPHSKTRNRADFSWELMIMLLHCILFTILIQFFIAFFVGKYVKGTFPCSKKTLIFAVYFWTPWSCLQNERWTFSIALFCGSFSIPQKSIAYESMGSAARALNIFIEINGFSPNTTPTVLFTFARALKGRSLHRGEEGVKNGWFCGDVIFEWPLTQRFTISQNICI